MEQWNQEGRKRMDDLLKPGATMLPEERVMYTMELQSDVEAQVEKHAKLQGEWDAGLKPTQEEEKSERMEVGARDGKVHYLANL